MRDVLGKCGNAGYKPKCRISRTIAGRLTPIERRKLLYKNTRTRVDTQVIGTRNNSFQLELKNRFTALEEHDDMDILNKNMTEMIQYSAMSIAKQTMKQKSRKYHRLQQL